MDNLSTAQRAARYKAYDLASDLVDQALEVVTNEAIFNDEEAAANYDLLIEAHSTLFKRKREFTDAS